MRTLLLTLLLLLPQMAAARVYMCTDPATGKTAFTDKACPTAGARAEVKVEKTNLDSGERYGREPRAKTWNSQEDTRKSGAEYNAERRAMYTAQNQATPRSQAPD